MVDMFGEVAQRESIGFASRGLRVRISSSPLGGKMMEFGDNRLKRITRFLYKWLWCSWKHKRSRCYPEVNKPFSNKWHCHKCHDCGEGLDIICCGQKMTWL